MVDRLRDEYSDRIDFVLHDEVWSDRESAAFASDNAIRGLPTMVLVEPDGTEIDRIIGAVDEQRLRSFLDGALE